MKKLSLKMGGIREMLTREQMKKVVGGYGYDDPSAPPACNIGPCSVTIIKNNVTTTNYGNCEVVIAVEWGKQVGKCRCSAYGGDQVTSNGGVSHCAG